MSLRVSLPVLAVLVVLSSSCATSQPRPSRPALQVAGVMVGIGGMLASTLVLAGGMAEAALGSKRSGNRQVLVGGFGVFASFGLGALLVVGGLENPGVASSTVTAAPSEPDR